MRAKNPVLAILCCLLTSALFAQKPDSTIWYAEKTTDFALTGDGQSANWKKAAWLLLPLRSLPPKGLAKANVQTKSNWKTQVKILYSDSGIYCLYRCEDQHITATLQEDFADLFNEDVIEAFFWTDESVPMYFEYELSPLNYELPILIPNIKGNFLGWRPWHYEGSRKTRHAVHIEKENGQVKYWTGEFYIPFLLLKPLPNAFAKPDTRWRANFYRMDYDSKDELDWSWQETRTNFHDYEKFGTLIFR